MSFLSKLAEVFKPTPAEKKAELAAKFPLKAGGYAAAPSQEKPAHPAYAASVAADREWESRPYGYGLSVSSSAPQAPAKSEIHVPVEEPSVLAND